MVDEEGLDPWPGKDKAAERAERHDIRDRRLAQDDRDLTKEVASCQAGAFGAVDDHGSLAIEDDVEA